MDAAVDEIPRDELLEREREGTWGRADGPSQLAVPQLGLERSEDWKRPLLERDVLDLAATQLAHQRRTDWSDASPVPRQDILGPRWMAISGIGHHEPRLDQRGESLTKRIPAETELIRQRDESAPSRDCKLRQDGQRPAMA